MNTLCYCHTRNNNEQEKESIVTHRNMVGSQDNYVVWTPYKDKHIIYDILHKILKSTNINSVNTKQCLHQGGEGGQQIRALEGLPRDYQETQIFGGTGGYVY
jgi:hypothetical protein